MTEFALSDYDLDDLQRYCHVVRVVESIQVEDEAKDFTYLVFYGRLIAGPSHIAVVQETGVMPYGLCYFCAYETHGRVALKTARGLIRELRVCCPYCYDIGRLYKGSGGLAMIGQLGRRARQRRQGYETAKTRQWVKDDALARESLFPRLIQRAKASEGWPVHPPLPDAILRRPDAVAKALLDEADALQEEAEALQVESKRLCRPLTWKILIAS